MDTVIEDRLRKGAVLLGNAWRAGQRCASGWGIKETGFPEGEDVFKVIERWACQCETKTEFCKVKTLWFRLAMTDLRESIEGDYGIAFMMSSEEWDLTKLTLKNDFKDIGVVGIGSGGTASMTDFWKSMKAPEALQSTLRVLKKFPGARVQGVQEAEPIADAAPSVEVVVPPEGEALCEEATG